uniref:Uncharacterized protein n=1 Tax=Octopus bimaculoides TaxID=37653 RepID=A0A0L8GNC7_OCTBM
MHPENRSVAPHHHQKQCWPNLMGKSRRFLRNNYLLLKKYLDYCDKYPQKKISSIRLS